MERLTPFWSVEDLFAIIQALKSSPNAVRGELVEGIQKTVHGQEEKASLEQQRERAINLAVRIMTMVNCSTQRQSSGLLEHGVHKVSWRCDATFSQFITTVFPMTDHPSLNDEDTKSSMDLKTALMARKIKKQAGLVLRPTDDLRSHLQLDRSGGSVEIYHHTAFLKEHLRLTKDTPKDMSVSDSLRL